MGNRYLVFARKLLAARFDTKTLSVVGSPVPVVDGVTHSLYNTTFNTITGAAQFSVSDNGSLIYAPGTVETAQPRRVYVRALNSVDATPITPAPEDTPSSWTPDGKEIAFVHTKAESGSALFDISLVAVDPPHKIRPLLNDPRCYYDVTLDGRFLMVQSLPEDVERGKKIFPSKLRIVQNWLAELDGLFAR